MRKKKILPFLFLVFLLLLISFIIGMRYGKHIESLNSSYEVSPSPPSPDGTEDGEGKEPITSFLLYQNATCEIEFLYPDILTINESSGSATLTKNTNSIIEFNCDSPTAPKGKKNKTILFQNEPIKATLIEEENHELYRFVITHPDNDKDISITVHAAYLSLLGRTLQYELSK
jgi:hypothetical protein